jgi:predicted small lipoprotein YifL
MIAESCSLWIRYDDQRDGFDLMAFRTTPQRPQPTAPAWRVAMQRPRLTANICYAATGSLGTGRVGISHRQRSWLFVAALVTMAALALTACGRKGPLDPPSASLTDPATPRPSLGEDNDIVPGPPSPDLRPQRSAAAPPPAAPPAPPKTFFLDFLIGK